MIKAVLFDVDDTLYDQQQPFQHAVASLFPTIFEKISTEDLYQSFRFHSDDIFTQYTSGRWSLEYMRVERFLRTFSPHAPHLTETDAANFQQSYQKALQTIQLHPKMQETLTWLTSQPVILGVITNGPGDHQQQKIDQLQLTRWIPSDHLFISGNVGYEKPNKEIFDYVAKQLALDTPNEIIYIGDSFENDIVGSYQAGWQNIWFNHRQRKIPLAAKMVHPDYTLTKFADAPSLIQTIIKS